MFQKCLTRNLVKKDIGIKELYLHSKHKNKHAEQSKDSESTQRRKSINIKERIHFHPRMITYELLEISKPSCIQKCSSRATKKQKQNHRIRLSSVMKLHVGLALINPIRIQSRPPKSFGTKA